MTSSASGVLLLPLRDLRVGPMRLSPYGACAAVGVVLSMALAGRSARRVNVSPEAVWDAGLFAMLSCFAASRLQLALSDPKAFFLHPVLVLSLPSVTIAAMALAAVAVAAYLWRKRLPILSVLDAFAPAGALLTAFLELGHWLDGSETGMPTSTPWATRERGDVLYLHPVALYGGVLYLLLAASLWRLISDPRKPGRIAALGSALGGLLAFGLDLITAPSELISSSPLEPGQMVALGAIAGGAVLWTFLASPAGPPP